MSRIIDRLLLVVGTVQLGIITLLVFMAAVMRFLGYPLIWSVDLAQLLFIWLCFIAAARAMMLRAHLGVDFLTRLLPFEKKRWLETLLYLVFVAFLLVLTVEGYQLTLLNSQRQFGDSGLSYAWVTIAVPAGSILLILGMTINLIEAWRSKSKKGALIFSKSEPQNAEESHLS